MVIPYRIQINRSRYKEKILDHKDSNYTGGVENQTLMYHIVKGRKKVWNM